MRLLSALEATIGVGVMTDALLNHSAPMAIPLAIGGATLMVWGIVALTVLIIDQR